MMLTPILDDGDQIGGDKMSTDDFGPSETGRRPKSEVTKMLAGDSGRNRE